jgi:hypothetical protein
VISIGSFTTKHEAAHNGRAHTPPSTFGWELLKLVAVNTLHQMRRAFGGFDAPGSGIGDGGRDGFFSCVWHEASQTDIRV